MQLSLFSDILPRNNKINRDQRQVWRDNFARREINKIKAVIALNKGSWISGEYKNGKSFIVVQCQCGHQWETRVEYINQGKWCPVCARVISVAGASKAHHINRIKREVDYILSGRAYFDSYNKNIKRIQLEIQKEQTRQREESKRPIRNKRAAARYKDKYTNELDFRVNALIKSQLQKCMVKDMPMGKYYKVLGYTTEQFIRYIESKFEEGMSWDNQGEWHLDHKRPKSWFALLNDDGSINHDQVKQCWSLDNLQPLWATENLSKNNRYEHV